MLLKALFTFLGLIIFFHRNLWIFGAHFPSLGCLCLPRDVFVSFLCTCQWFPPGVSGIPTGFDNNLPSLGWEFDNSVLLQCREHCQHCVDGDSRSTAHDVKPSLERLTVPVRVNLYIFCTISSGTAWLLQGMFTTEKRRYNLKNGDKSL